MTVGVTLLVISMIAAFFMQARHSFFTATSWIFAIWIRDRYENDAEWLGLRYSPCVGLAIEFLIT
jgi:hypothetical protein